VQALLGGHVPNLDRVIGGSRHEAAVVRRKCDGQDPARVAGQGAHQGPVVPKMKGIDWLDWFNMEDFRNGRAWIILAMVEHREL